MVAAHKSATHKGKFKCKKCGKKHHFSEHWSHTHGGHEGSHGESAWFGRAKRPQGRKAAASSRRRGKHVVRRAFRRGGTEFGAVHSTPSKRKRATWGSMSAAEVRRAGRKARRGKKRLVAAHLAKNPKSRGKHRVAAHMASAPATHRRKGGGKGKRRSARLVAMNKGRKGGHKKASSRKVHKG